MECLYRCTPSTTPYLLVLLLGWLAPLICVRILRVLWKILRCQGPGWRECHLDNALPAMGCLHIIICLFHLTCGVTESIFDLDLLVEGIRVKIFTATVPVAKDKMPIWLKGIDCRINHVADGVVLQDDRVVE